MAHSPTMIYSAQWKATHKYSSNETHPISIMQVGFTYLLPIGIGVTSFTRDATLNFADSLLTMLGILAAALITAFSQLASWRKQLTDEGDSKILAHSPERWLIDSSVSHIIAGAYSSVIACILIITSMAITIPDSWTFPHIHSLGSALITLMTSHTIVSLLLALPGLYSAYIQLNKIDDSLNPRIK